MRFILLPLIIASVFVNTLSADIKFKFLFDGSFDNKPAVKASIIKAGEKLGSEFENDAEVAVKVIGVRKKGKNAPIAVAEGSHQVIPGLGGFYCSDLAKCVQKWEKMNDDMRKRVGRVATQRIEVNLEYLGRFAQKKAKKGAKPINLESVIQHELLHLLGINSRVGSTSNYFTTFDRNVVDEKGVCIVDGCGEYNTKAYEAVKNKRGAKSLYYTSSNLEAAFGKGYKIELNGMDASHFKKGLMGPRYPNGRTVAIDKEIRVVLKDLGYRLKRV